jgi:hypothetical protein
MKNVRIKDCAEIYRNIFPDLKVEVIDSKFEDQRNYRVSTEKAERGFIFRPYTSVEEEVHRMLNLLRSMRIKNPLDSRYYNTHHVKATLDEIRKFES